MFCNKAPFLGNPAGAVYLAKVFLKPESWYILKKLKPDRLLEVTVIYKIRSAFFEKSGFVLIK